MKIFSLTFKIGAVFLISLMWASAVSAQTAANNSLASADCMSCHDKKISSHDYNASVHNSLRCTACHIKDETANVSQSTKENKSCPTQFKPMDCSSCHPTVAKEHAASAHNSERLPVKCSKCHYDIHKIKSLKNNKLAAAKLCGQCHEYESEYFKSIHYTALEKGNKDAATCTDCHGKHAINRIDNIAQGRKFHTEACLKCHGDTAKMNHSQVTTIAPETYFDSYHGKTVRLGYPEKVAGCADCHGSHNILPKEDSLSTVNKANLNNTCKQCHTKASGGFSKYIPHAEPTNRSKYPNLYWVTIFMNALMAGTFIFFWIHSLLWAFRGYVEKRQNRNNQLFSKSGEQHNEGTKIRNKVYRRFKPVHIILHLFVISSFLGLALSGLPLKFNHTEWGKVLMDFFGGTENAGMIHRIGAMITFGYFFVTLFMSGKFLFSKKNSKESFGKRLFGADSLFPNRKDMRDIAAMFRWFFFRGPKPIFDRWTYWEKFDFLAVFWGVAVIGSSGLVLWFPVFFGKFLPGWLFNIATIVHSDEALLAVVFIFTIHFFNTHLRFEKFPMDFVIFNGQVSEEEMIHERGEQWKRYQEQGIAEQFEMKKPSSLALDFVLRMFGFLAVLTGTVLALLILYTFLG